MSAPARPTNPALDDDEDLDLWNSGPPRRVAQPPPPAASDSSDSSDEESEDTAARQTRLAKARLRDHEEISTQPTNAQTNLSPAAAPISLPSAADIFTAVAGPPAFLNPEATRQIVTLSNQGTGGQGQRADAGTLPGGDTREGAWDISRMAPKLAGEEELQPGVISARAKKYKGADGAAVEASAAQVAMLGGNPAERRDRGKGTKAMGVDEFLEKGVGGAQLPRKQQDRKDKEKSKRERGQSTHSHWKSEAEMALRQQYD